VSLRPRTLRGRLVLVLGLVTVVVAASVAVFVLLRYRSDFDRQIDDSLETRFADVRSALRHAPRPVSAADAPIIPKAEVFAQVLSPSGAIIDASPEALLDEPLLGRAALARAQRHRTTVERAVPPRADEARLLAGAEHFGRQNFVVVVGASLDESARAQQNLERALAVALPALVGVVIGVGWLLVGAALRPMETMVAEAEAISATRRGRRLSEHGPTELAELARHLNEMLARIEAAVDHERAFLDDASHELRTPIAIARGELELARPIVGRDPAVAEAVESALEEIVRLESRAVNLLVLARTRAGQLPQLEVDVRAVCDRAVDGQRRAHGLQPIVVDVGGHGNTIGDAAALERAVANLVDNAMRHAEHRVDVAIATANGTTAIEVADDGPGYPDVIVERGTERFVAGAVGGTGLGLAIVDAIATAHGGTLELGARADGVHGARARLVLPGGVGA
jgi:two-component system OmpR family sensor kinase